MLKTDALPIHIHRPSVLLHLLHGSELYSDSVPHKLVLRTL